MLRLMQECVLMDKDVTERSGIFKEERIGLFVKLRTVEEKEERFGGESFITWVARGQTLARMRNEQARSAKERESRRDAPMVKRLQLFCGKAGKSNRLNLFHW